MQVFPVCFQIPAYTSFQIAGYHHTAFYLGWALSVLQCVQLHWHRLTGLALPADFLLGVFLHDWATENQILPGNR